MGFCAEFKIKDLKQMAGWTENDDPIHIIDEKFAFKNAPQAVAKLKTGRAKGKVVLEVSSDGFSGS